MMEHNAFVKASQNRQMAQQILSQATMILQRFNALAQDSQQGAAQGSSFLQAAQGQQISAVSSAAVDGLSQMMQRYEQLRTTSDTADNQAQLNMERFSQLNQNLAQVLGQTRSYKSSLRLQSMSEFDTDNEDKNALGTQVDSVTAYVNRLRQACADILTHFDERKQRREMDIRALKEARGAISIDNVQESHDQLQEFAQKTDQAAAQMLSTSTSAFGGAMAQQPQQPQQPQQVNLASSMGMLSQLAGNLGGQPMSQASPVPQATPFAPQASQPQQQQQQLLQLQQQQKQLPRQVAATQMQQQAPPAATSGTSASILGDLKSLQDLNFQSSEQQNGGGLNMLSAR